MTSGTVNILDNQSKRLTHVINLVVQGRGMRASFSVTVSMKRLFRRKDGEKTDFNNGFMCDSVSISSYRPLITLFKSFVRRKMVLFSGDRDTPYLNGC